MTENIKKNSNTTLEIVEAEEAIGLLSNRSFTNKWSELYEECPWGTVFQSPDFVTTWYSNYRNEFFPVIVCGWEGEQLIGILPLAIRLDDNGNIPEKEQKFVVAGNYFAIYQTWLSTNAHHANFISLFLRGFFRNFPKSSINLRFLPNQVPLNELRIIPEFKSLAVLHKNYNPKLDYSLDYAPIFSKRHFKAKHNRIKRAGKFEFTRIMDTQSLTDALESIGDFMDVRQGAVFNKAPFDKDPNQKLFFVEMMQAGLLNASVLKLDGKLIAAILIIQDGEYAHLAGLITYSPFHSKLSPGIVHLYLLGKKFAEEGIKCFNFSPGYDEFKTRFSNSREVVYELMLSPSSLEKIHRKSRNWFYNFLLDRGIRPMDYHVFINKKKSLVTNRLGNIYKFLSVRKKFQYKDLVDLQKSLQLSGDFENGIFRKNQLKDLLLFKEEDFTITKWEFLEDALKRLDQQQNFLTLVENNRLLLCIWIQNNYVDSENDEMNKKENNKAIPGKFYINLNYDLEKIKLQNTVGVIPTLEDG